MLRSSLAGKDVPHNTVRNGISAENGRSGGQLSLEMNTGTRFHRNNSYKRTFLLTRIASADSIHNVTFARCVLCYLLYAPVKKTASICETPPLMPSRTVTFRAQRVISISDFTGRIFSGDCRTTATTRRTSAGYP